MREELLSVLIPVYNTGKYLHRCLESVINQSYRNLEIICVNDGSTDNSLEILEEFKKKDDRIHIITKENGGLVSARKAALKAAAGVYVTYVDSDDWIEPCMYTEMMKHATGDVEVITSDCYRDYGEFSVRDAEGIAPGEYSGNCIKELKSKIICSDMFFKRNIQPSLWNKIYLKKYLEKYQYSVDDSITVCEDDACVYPCILGAHKIYVTRQAFYHYVIRANSMMDSKDDDDIPRLEKAFSILNRAFCSNEEISNGREQYEALRMYNLLLRNPEKVITVMESEIPPFGKIHMNSRLVLYGAGRFGKALKSVIEKEKKHTVVAWVDRSGEGNEILLPEEIASMEYDYIFVSVLLHDIADEVKQFLLSIGVVEEKIKMAGI